MSEPASGNPGSEPTTTLNDPERTKHRVEMLNQVFRGLLLLNGGGSAVLLTFLSTLRQGQEIVAASVICGVILLGIGLLLTIAWKMLEYSTSIAHQRAIRIELRKAENADGLIDQMAKRSIIKKIDDSGSWRTLELIYYYTMWASWFMFAITICILATAYIVALSRGIALLPQFQ
jgi:hypothetical protein